MEISLSESDIQKICGCPVPILSYLQLKNYKTIEQVLNNPLKAVVLLYEWKKNYGHWVLLFQSRINRIEFFDSYGYKPDDESEWIPKAYWKWNYLSQLLADASENGWEIEYNNYILQNRDNKSIATCGRWVGMRLRLKNWDLDSFAKRFLQTSNPDKAITEATKPFLGK